MTVTPTSPAASQQAAVDAALLVLKSMGLSPDDLTAATRQRLPMPTFADYVPVVSAAVTDGTRKAYGTYWNRITEQWGTRRLDEPTPSEVRQLMKLVKANAVQRRNGRGGRSAAGAPGRRAALPVPARRGRRPDQRAGQPRPQGRQAPPPALHPPGRGQAENVMPPSGYSPDTSTNGRRTAPNAARVAAQSFPHEQPARSSPEPSSRPARQTLRSVKARRAAP